MSAIKTCSKCGGLYTGGTPFCYNCCSSRLTQSPSSPAPALLISKSRAERRAATLTKTIPNEAKKHEINWRKTQQQPTAARSVPPLSKQNASRNRIDPTDRKGQQSKIQKAIGIDSHKRSLLRPCPQNSPSVQQTVGYVSIPLADAGLGTLAATQGSFKMHQLPNGSLVRKEVSVCSCGGENAKCYKCDGTGYYEREIYNGANPQGATSHLRSNSGLPKSTEVSFSKDSRGGETYAIREQGRYGSNPLHDDYDN